MEPPCPACGDPLYGWAELRPPGRAEWIVLRRCERCGLGAAEGLSRDEAAAALAGSARDAGSGGLEIRVANRRSVQAGLGGRHWAALEPARRLYLTPESLRRLAPRAGLRVESLRSARWGRCQAWMWQTLLNALTFHDNFMREARAGRLRPRTGRGRLAFAIDLLVSVLAAPLVALVSLPLELTAALAGRGGELVAEVSPGRRRGLIGPTRPPAARRGGRGAASACGGSAGRRARPRG